MDAETYPIFWSRCEVTDLCPTRRSEEDWKPSDDECGDFLNASVEHFRHSASNFLSQECVQCSPTSGISGHLIQSTCTISQKALEKEKGLQKDIHGGVWRLATQVMTQSIQFLGFPAPKPQLTTANRPINTSRSRRKVPKAPSHLLLLPTELRLQVWSFVFSPPHYYPRKALSLLRTNHQIYSEAFPFAYPHIRLYLPGIVTFKQNLLTFEPRQIAQLHHLRLPVARLSYLGIAPFIISRIENLRLNTLTLTLSALHEPQRSAEIGYLRDLRKRLDKITNIKFIIINNDGYYGDWEFLLLFLRMHNFDQRIELKESFAIKSGLWEYKMKRRRKRGKGGYFMIIRALNYH